MEPLTPHGIDAGINRIARYLTECRDRHPLRSKKSPPFGVSKLHDLFAEAVLLHCFYRIWQGQYLSDPQLTPLPLHGQPVGWPGSDVGAVGEALVSLTNDYELVSCGQKRDGTRSYGVRKPKVELLWRMACVFRQAEIERLKLEPWIKRRKPTSPVV